MKRFNFIFIILLFLLLFCACDREEISQIELDENPTLDFLVNNSDHIAIIDIFDAPKKGPSSKYKSAKIASAQIIENLKGEEAKQIKIHQIPYYKRKGSVLAFTMLRNGKYLAFLKKGNQEEENYFRPITGSSLVSIFQDKIQPIWTDGIESANQQGLALETVITEIKKITEEN